MKRNVNSIALFNLALTRMDDKRKPGRLIFTADYKRVNKYINRYIKKHYGKNAPIGGINDVFGYFTEDNKKWFKIMLVSKTSPAEIPEWNEVWIDKTLKKEIITERILPKAKGKYKIHWI